MKRKDIEVGKVYVIRESKYGGDNFARVTSLDVGNRSVRIEDVRRDDDDGEFIPLSKIRGCRYGDRTISNRFVAREASDAYFAEVETSKARRKAESDARAEAYKVLMSHKASVVARAKSAGIRVHSQTKNVEISLEDLSKLLDSYSASLS